MATATRSRPERAEEVDRETGEVTTTEIIPTISEAGLRAEVDQQIATAKRYPRNLKTVLDMARSMALIDEDVAASCCYTVPRAGKQIKGPSVRLAEIMAISWGNIRCEARVGDLVGGFVTAEGICWDLERNVAVRVVKKRRATDRHGNIYSDDMIQNTLNAAASVALRDAIFRVIPKTFTHAVYDQAEETAVGKQETLAGRRGKAIDYFARFGITPERICQTMGRNSVEELTLDDVAGLKALVESVRRGDKNIDDAFPDPNAKGSPATTEKTPERGAAGLAKRLNTPGTGDGAPGATPIKTEVDRQMEQALNGDAAATKTAASPEEESRRAKAVRAAKGCDPSLAGCSKDAADYSTADGRKVCANHASEQQSRPAAEPEKTADGSLPGMGAEEPKPKPKSKR